MLRERNWCSFVKIWAEKIHCILYKNSITTNLHSDLMCGTFYRPDIKWHVNRYLHTCLTPLNFYSVCLLLKWSVKLRAQSTCLSVIKQIFRSLPVLSILTRLWTSNLSTVLQNPSNLTKSNRNISLHDYYRQVFYFILKLWFLLLVKKNQIQVATNGTTTLH